LERKGPYTGEDCSEPGSRTVGNRGPWSDAAGKTLSDLLDGTTVRGGGVGGMGKQKSFDKRGGRDKRKSHRRQDSMEHQYGKS